jgi:hypothetical protein
MTKRGFGPFSCGIRRSLMIKSKYEKGANPEKDSISKMSQSISISLRKVSDKPIINAFVDMLNKQKLNPLDVKEPQGLGEAVKLYSFSESGGEPWSDDIRLGLRPSYGYETEISLGEIEKTAERLDADAASYEKRHLVEAKYKIIKRGRVHVAVPMKETDTEDELVAGSYNLWVMCSIREEAARLRQIERITENAGDGWFLTICEG